MKSLAILFFIVLFSVGASASEPSCLTSNLSKMTWTERFNTYTAIMHMAKEEQHQVCLLDFFYKIRKDFVIETLKGEESYKEFFNQVQQHFAIEEAKPILKIQGADGFVSVDEMGTLVKIEAVKTMEARNQGDPKYYDNLIKLDHVAPLMLFFQQVWMEQALDRWLERKGKSSSRTTIMAGAGAAVLTVGLFLFPPTRKMTHRTLNVLMRIFKETSKSKLAAFLVVPSAAISQSSDGDAIAKYKKLRAQYRLPLSPFELTEHWLNTTQNDLMDTEADQFWSDLTSISTSAATGTGVGLLTKRLLTFLKVKNKLFFLGATVGATMVTTKTMEKVMAESLYQQDYERVVRKLHESLYDIDGDLRTHRKGRAYLNMYGLVNEMEIYALLKIRDADVKINIHRKLAINSCWPAWSSEEVAVHAKLLQKDLKEQFRFANSLFSDFKKGTSDLLEKSYPYFSERLGKIQRFIDIMTSEKYLEDVLHESIVTYNECYKP